MSQKTKICIISFDNWHYDKEIVNVLNQKNIDANHINFRKFKYKNIFERIGNSISKIVLNKNLKLKKRQDYILETLMKLGKQDQILVLNPDLIDKECHLEIKKHTNRYIAYLYDSVIRSMYPIEHLLDGVFDEIFSFDKADSEKYNFKKTNNYIYLQKQPIPDNFSKEFMVLIVASFDKRFVLLNKIANQLSELNYNIKFILISKNIVFKKLKFKIMNLLNHSDCGKINPKIQFESKKISLKNLKIHYDQTNIILDLVQGQQTGLSFRVFEALGLQKKLITDNKSIKDYSFYNPNNILVIDENKIVFEPFFFETPYEPIPENIYNQFTLDKWVDNVFGLTIKN